MSRHRRLRFVAMTCNATRRWGCRVTSHQIHLRLQAKHEEHDPLRQSHMNINAADLFTVTGGYLTFKYADDTYIVTPAANVSSRCAELDNVDRWAESNNLRLNRAKSVEIIFTGCKRKPTGSLPLQIPGIRRVTSIKMLGVTMSNHLSFGEHVREVIGKCAQSMFWSCCVTTAWMTIRWGTSTRPSSYLNCCVPHRRGGDLPARLTGNVSRHLYDALFGPTSPRCLDSLKTATTNCLTISGTTLATSTLVRQERLHIQSSTSPTFFLFNLQDWSQRFC